MNWISMIRYRHKNTSFDRIGGYVLSIGANDGNYQLQVLLWLLLLIRQGAVLIAVWQA